MNSINLMDPPKCSRCGRIDAQHKMWRAIKNHPFNGYCFNRYVLIEPFIVDFACLAINIIVELDALPQGQQLDHDQYRTQYLRGKGFLVIRFWREQVLSDLPKVIGVLKAQIGQVC